MELHGRASEVGALADAVQSVARGSSAVVFVEGEGGIGKSRLVEEARGAAARRGFTACYGRAEELERTRPFGVLADALGCTRRSPDPQRAAIGQLVIGDLTGTLERVDDPSLQFRVIEAFVELLEDMAAHGPVLLVLEDLHWADSSTLLGTRAIVRRVTDQPLLVVASLRPAPRSRELDLLIESCTDEGATWLRLAPLSDEAVLDLATEVLAGDPQERLRGQLRRAGGNPLFLLELLNALAEQDVLEREGSRVEVAEVSLPAALAVTILRRLTPLSEPARELLRLASVLGSTVAVGDLLVVAQRSAMDTSPLLTEIFASGLLGEDGAAIVFRHDLVREAIYTDIPRPVRQGLHREAGRALSAAGVGAVRVATHVWLGASVGDTEAVAWLRGAATAAAPRSASLAAELLERAVELLDPTDPRRDEVETELAEALAWAGRVLESEQLARALLARTKDPRLTGALRLQLARTKVMRGGARDAVEISATTELGVLTENERVEIRAIEAWGRALTGELPAAAAVAAELRPLAQRLGADGPWCIATMVLAMTQAYAGHLELGISLASEVIERGGIGGLSAQRMALHSLLAMTLVDADRFAEAEQTLEIARRVSDSWGISWTSSRLHHVSTSLRFVTGEWDSAEAELHRWLATEKSAPSGLVGYAHAKRALIATHRGDLTTAGRYLDLAEQARERSGLLPRTCWIAWARGSWCEAVGHDRDAAEAYQLAWTHATASDALTEYPRLAPDLVRLLLATGARDRAGAVTTATQEAAERMNAPWATSAFLRCRGLLDADVNTLIAAVDALRGVPRPLEFALAAEDAGLAAARAGQHREAGGLLDEARATFTALGAQQGAARLAARARALGVRKGKTGARQSATTGWAAVTDSERRVASLAAEGLTNHQIATRLFLSRHTVTSHLAHVYVKLGITSRVELALEVTRRAQEAGTNHSLE